MMERRAKMPSHLPYRRRSNQNEESSGVDWAPSTSSASAAANINSNFSFSSVTGIPQADLNGIGDEIHGNANPRNTLQMLADQTNIPFKSGPSGSVTNNGDARSATLHEEHRTDSPREVEIGGQHQSQGTKRPRMGTFRQKFTETVTAEGGRAGAQSTRPYMHRQSASNLERAFENTDANSPKDQPGQWPSRSGSLQSSLDISPHDAANKVVHPPFQVSTPTTMLSGDGVSQPAPSSTSPYVETLHGHRSHLQSHHRPSTADTRLQDNAPACRNEFSDNEEFPEEMNSRYRKRRRRATSSHSVTPLESQQLAEQRMSTSTSRIPQSLCLSPSASSKPSQAQAVVVSEVPRSRSIQDSSISHDISSILREFNLNVETELQSLVSAFSRTTNTHTLNNTPRNQRAQNHNEMVLVSLARGKLNQLCQCLELHLPPPLPIGSKNILFLSETFPRSFDQQKRTALLEIFRTSAPYVPSCINLATGLRCGIQYHVCSPSTRRTRRTRLPLGPSGRGWPSDSLPLEVFQIIVDFLPRDSLQNMRLVNHEFEKKVSSTLFHTVVVPFRPEIYGMILPNSGKLRLTRVDIKGKGKDSFEQREKSLHDGIRTFQGWGPHIKKFAMAFEVEESTLETPPIKGQFETHPTFWGRYKWPHPEYNRFEYCEDLERKADESSRMTNALSYLTGITELALSIDSGLGWLNGPDLSERARVSRERPRVFGKRQRQPDATFQKCQDSWKGTLKPASKFHTHPEIPNEHGLYEATLEWQPHMKNGLPVQVSFHGQPLSAVYQNSASRSLFLDGIDVRRGDHDWIYDDFPEDESPSRGITPALIPNVLSTPQREWLLETEWAQRAFLCSFCMALCDNSQTFSVLTTLNIARLSSRHLQPLQRKDIWVALERLKCLTIHISADWRTVVKAATGIVDTPSIRPSDAAGQFYNLLKSQISGLKNVKKLNIGYVGGGEHQTGIHGRNRFILPAPLGDLSDLANVWLSRTVPKTLLPLPYVEDLTLTNCWFTPHFFRVFCTRARLTKLRTLRLDSVSLTSHSENDDAMEELSTELGTYDTPQGRPRYGDPSIANFFDLRPDDVPAPSPGGWATTPQRKGSWGNVIDFVTPGANLDLVRYAYHYYDKDYFDSLKHPNRKRLEEITFDSCGYVQLTDLINHRQTTVGAPPDTIPPFLAKRASEIRPFVMEPKNDVLLGQIVPRFPDEEKDVLETGFPMRFGWLDEAKALECLEDGQLRGGSGRFSGKVQRLTFAPQSV